MKDIHRLCLVPSFRALRQFFAISKRQALRTVIYWDDIQGHLGRVGKAKAVVLAAVLEEYGGEI